MLILVVEKASMCTKCMTFRGKKFVQNSKWLKFAIKQLTHTMCSVGYSSTDDFSSEAVLPWPQSSNADLKVYLQTATLSLKIFTVE